MGEDRGNAGGLVLVNNPQSLGNSLYLGGTHCLQLVAGVPLAGLLAFKYAAAAV
jgi:hypothetical protein